MFICAIACTILVAWVSLYLSCQALHKDCSNIFCGPAEWLVWIAYTSFFVPYGLRCYRIIKIFSVDDDALIDNAKYWDSMVLRESWLVKLFLVALFLSALVKYSLDLVDPGNMHILGYGCAKDPGYVWIGLNFLEILCCCLLLFKLRFVRDDYGIKKELHIVCVLWVITTIVVLIAKLLRQGMFQFINLTLSDVQYLDVHASTIVVRNTLVFVASVAYPVCRSYSAAYATLWSNCHALESLDALLKDIVCVQYFRQFLIREAHVEYILCWVEIELFKDCDDTGMLRAQARRIFDKYLCEDAELEVLVSKHEPDQHLKPEYQTNLNT